MTTTPQDPNHAKLKAARAEIEAILKKHDIAGHCVLHAPGWCEDFWSLWPSYSVLQGDFPLIRLKSVAATYGGDTQRMTADRANTAQMVHGIGTSLAQSGLQWLELANVLNNKLGATHVDMGHLPDPSRLNTGGMH